MSTGNVDLIHVRLKDELARLSLKPAAAARAAGEEDSQGLRDVLGGRKRLTADLLAGLEASGVDVRYVLSGHRSAAPDVISADERELLTLFRTAPLAVKAAAIGALQGGSTPRAQKQSAFSIGTNHGHVIDGDVVNNGPLHFGNITNKK